MQTFLIQSRGIEALRYNADVQLLLIKYSSGEIRSFTRISQEGLRRLLGADTEIDEGSKLSDSEYQAEFRKGGLKALYHFTGINPAQFDFSAGPRIW
ncbi:hypothetical protein NE852_09110 [Rhizobium sp. Pop5]|nr:hypothetical protein NE852_09110 [Rhizobium sp. Pop5]